MVEKEVPVEGNSWRVESFRVTAFHGLVDDLHEAARIWEAATGQSPEHVSSRPREGIHVAEGEHESNFLVVNCRRDRIDLILRPIPPSPGVPINGFLTMGPFYDLLPTFLESAVKWLQTYPSTIRLAFGSVLLMEVESVIAGNERMNQILQGVKIDATESHDFFYQINRRRISNTLSDLRLNRLSKWSVIQGGSVGFMAGGDPVVQISPPREFFACRLELDVNTVGNLSEPIPTEMTGAVFNELVVLGREIATEGDIA